MLYNFQTSAHVLYSKTTYIMVSCLFEVYKWQNAGSIILSFFTWNYVLEIFYIYNISFKCLIYPSTKVSRCFGISLINFGVLVYLLFNSPVFLYNMNDCLVYTLARRTDRSYVIHTSSVTLDTAQVLVKVAVPVYSPLGTPLSLFFPISLSSFNFLDHLHLYKSESRQEAFHCSFHLYSFHHF